MTMPCPMPCPMPYPMQMPTPGQCPMCGKSTKWRDDEDFDLEEEDDRYPKAYYPHYYKPYYHPFYHPYHHHPYHKPYHPYGPWWMKRDFEE
jgi:hypothetical protein